jgi:hypothetical protein
VIDHPRGPSAAKMEFPAVVNFATRCGVERDRPVVPTRPSRGPRHDMRGTRVAELIVLFLLFALLAWGVTDQI